MTSAGDLSEDLIFLHDSVIRGHHISKISGLPHTFQLVIEVKPQKATPIKRMRLIDNGLRRKESMRLINNVCLIVGCAYMITIVNGIMNTTGAKPSVLSDL